MTLTRFVATPYTIEHMTAHQHPEHTELDTATLWTLHLEVPGSIDPRRAITAILTTGAEVLTGEYCGGDSFAEWCESMDDGYPDSLAHRSHRGRALHVYFTSPNRHAARVAAREILHSAVRLHRGLEGGAVLEDWLDPEHAGITAGGDWAEYVEIWNRPLPPTVHTIDDSIAEIEHWAEVDRDRVANGGPENWWGQS